MFEGGEFKELRCSCPSESRWRAVNALRAGRKPVTLAKRGDLTPRISCIDSSAPTSSTAGSPLSSVLFGVRCVDLLKRHSSLV